MSRTIDRLAERQQAPGGTLRRGSLVMAALYVRTRPVHQRVEAQLGLLDPDLSMERLRAVITRFFAFWSTNAPRPEAGAAMIGASVMESSARDDTTILAVYRSAPD